MRWLRAWRRERLRARLLKAIRSPITEDAGANVRMERVDYPPDEQIDILLEYDSARLGRVIRRVRVVGTYDLVGSFGREIKYVFAVDYEAGGVENRFGKRKIISLALAPD